MNITTEIAAARVHARALRSAADACSREQGALKVRLVAAADSLESLALLTLSALERIEQLTTTPLQGVANG